MNSGIKAARDTTGFYALFLFSFSWVYDIVFLRLGYLIIESQKSREMLLILIANESLSKSFKVIEIRLL